MSMGKRVAIVAGVIVLAGMLVLMIPRKRIGSVSAASLGTTNFAGQTYCVLSASNGTDRAVSISAWAEWSTNGSRWNRESLHSEEITLRPMRDSISCILLPTRGQQRVTLIYGMEGEGQGWNYWFRHLRMLLGQKPFGGNRLHVDVDTNGG